MIKKSLRDDCPAQNPILSAQSAPAGRFSSSKYNLTHPKGPCGMTFCHYQSEIYDIGTEIRIFHCFATNMLKSFWKSISKALVEILRSTISKRDLKHSDTFFWKFACDLGFAASGQPSGSKMRFDLPKKPQRGDLPAQNTIWSIQKAPARRLSCQKYDFLAKINLFGIWVIQNVEQVRLVSVATLPASETINRT